MGESEIIKGILEADSDISNIRVEEDTIYFELFGSEYGMLFFDKNEREQFPVILIRNYEKYDYPHIMTSEYKMGEDIYRGICLFESDKVVKYLYPYEEKIYETIDRLKSLLQLNEIEKEEEFQKEFLFYWNQNAKTDVDVFLMQERCFQRLNLYGTNDKERKYRFVSNGIRLNDAEEYTHIANCEGFYIPITDNRRIVPPGKDRPWTMKEVMSIVEGIPYSRISRDTYERLALEKSKAEKILLVFEMIINRQSYNFGVLIKFNNQAKASLLDRLKYSVKEIIACTVNRADIYFLNMQIGNDLNLIKKNIAIIGCGSLGSYIAEELARAGVKRIALYDEDKVEYENVFRHRAFFAWKGFKKVLCMKTKIEAIHPEIFVETYGNISEEKLIAEMGKYDMIIYAVGSSDLQLVSNRVFKKQEYDKLVVFAWLEAGGMNSHILVVDYSKKGCYECLFTNEIGEMINNKANSLNEDMSDIFKMQNGCGATRVAYGTSVLLRTTSVLLDTVKKIYNGDIIDNILINIEDFKLTTDEKFSEGKCKCCGDTDK